MKQALTLFLPLFLTACQAADAQKSVVKPAAISAAAERGFVLYESYCANCHGLNMEGGQAPSLADAMWEYGGGDADIIQSISVGIESAGMPGFADSLSESDQTDLLAYIRTGGVMKTTPPIHDVPSIEDQVKMTDYVTGLDEPWGFVFTGAQDLLITEKKGDLRQVIDGVLQDEPIKGTPKVNASRQGGLLDVALDPDYTENKWVYLSFSDPLPDDKDKVMTKIVRGKIVDGIWTDQQVLFAAQPEDYIATGFHYGSRMTFDNMGHLFFSIGDRGKKEEAQDINRPNGKIFRIKRDGSIPADNPFLDCKYPQIYAYGNRNPQGLVVHPDTGVLWETEHGPKGGDELNAIEKGANYGWPKISYGRNYNGTVLTPHTALPGMAQPVSQWTPSIAVCGLDVYTGDLFPEWRGRLMAGGLAYETVRLIDVEGKTYENEAILMNDKGRVRDVTTGPDGAIYVALPSHIIRLSPVL